MTGNTRPDLDTAAPPREAAPPKKSWRDTLPIHPAADLFPLLSPDELKALAEDIKRNGLRHPATVRLDDGNCVLLDGRNRLDALELLGEDITLGNDSIFNTILGADPYAYVISANIHRRHLNVEERQTLVIEIIARAPKKSNRQIGKQIGVDHKTIARARAKGEDVGRIPHVETRTDTKGRNQPVAKHKPKPPAGNDADPQESGARRKAEVQTDLEDFAPKSAMNRSAATELWTDDQLKRKAAAESGLCVVVANMHKGADEALIAWAKAHGRFVQIDRKTDWGNYFEEGEDGTRDEVVAKYAEFCLPNKNGLLAKLPTLRGMVLGCWCHPKTCHGHIIAEAVNRLDADPEPPEAAPPSEAAPNAQMRP